MAPCFVSKMKQTVLTLAFILWSATSAAGPVAAPVRAEIDALLEKLQRSGCQFNRNGTWYSGTEAKGHPLRKFAYLERKGRIDSAEQFIEIAASRSSTTGKAYRVKCGREAPVESRQWLAEQLAAIKQRADARRSDMQSKSTGVD